MADRPKTTSTGHGEYCTCERCWPVLMASPGAQTFLQDSARKAIRRGLISKLQLALGYPTDRKVRQVLADLDATEADVAFVLSKLEYAQRQPDGSVKEGWVKAVLRSAQQSRGEKR
ncbi:MAG: hypothetical protein Q7K03_09180 [Dehalococcoidia bacterium]|nr:hypothetical protein [Dehalococcoidia bacterium]